MKIIGKVFSLIFSIIFFIGITIFGFLFLTSKFFNPNYYTEMLDSIEIKEIKVSELGIEDLTNEFGDVTIEEAIVISLEKEDIDSEVALEIIESKEIKEILGKVISGIVDYEVTNETLPQLDKTDIDKLLDNKQINEIIQKENIEIDREELLNQINKTLKEELGDINE